MLRLSKIPPTSIINDLYSPSIPDVILSLNSFEKILIQRAKAFQVIVRMESISGRQQPLCNMIEKVVRRTFHLPLPIEETLKKLPNSDDTILNNELFILVRSVPSTKKKIWESLVDVNKIYNALIWLKENNHLYSNIIIPNYETFENNFQNIEVHFIDSDLFEKENNIDCEKVSKQNEGIELNIEEQTNLHAFLTQRDINDTFYEQFTIHALNEPRNNAKASELYQMLKINENPIDHRDKELDLKCFPAIYPFGQNGQYCNRLVKLKPTEYIKSRLLSYNPIYRTDSRYLFFLLNEANIRSLKAGIYHKLNITSATEKLTSAECLKRLQNNELEGNLTTIFGRLRNTNQYWLNPRSDIELMITWYGPVTFFLTLSPAEYNWKQLESFLRKINNDTENGKSISALIAHDPVSTSRMIDNEFKAMLEFISADNGPLGKVKHYAWRREYQSRGLQHFHIIIWIDEAPIIGKNSNEEVVNFIAKTITCHLPDK